MIIGFYELPRHVELRSEFERIINAPFFISIFLPPRALPTLNFFSHSLKMELFISLWIRLTSVNVIRLQSAFSLPFTLDERYREWALNGAPSSMASFSNSIQFPKAEKLSMLSKYKSDVVARPDYASRVVAKQEMILEPQSPG